MKVRWMFVYLLFGLSLLMVGCEQGDDRPSPASPTPPVTVLPTQTMVAAAPTQTPGGPSLTPSPTIPPTVTAVASPLPPPPTDLPTATPTPGPYEHVIQAGDSCLAIALEYGHLDPSVKDAIEALNGMADCSILPGPGSTILIPRPTATFTPVGADLTQTMIATSAPPNVTLQAGPSFSLQPYTVQDGDTLSSIAIVSDSSLQQICALNPPPNGIDCTGCKWESPNCCCPRPPQLSIGQQINIPAPTPTPTFTPTFTGSETPTATPTHRAPLPVYPAPGVTVSGPVRLMWLSSGVLAENEYYLVLLRDESSGQVFSQHTRQLSLDLPAEYLPSDGSGRTFAWQVNVVVLGSDGLFYPAGPVVPEQRFAWAGW